uniref:Secreted protein n=1 Tax=Macrostomum lignano TaxID=282301 RepID=A0A1I8HYZ3_9PLAT
RSAWRAAASCAQCCDCAFACRRFQAHREELLRFSVLTMISSVTDPENEALLLPPPPVKKLKSGAVNTVSTGRAPEVIHFGPESFNPV